MTSPVHWQSDGTPVSPRFDDIYRSGDVNRRGGLEQAQQVFLSGCDLPGRWAHQPVWQILETGFGLGLNFLAAWHAWQCDPAQPARLFYSAVEAFPPEADDLLKSAAPFPELLPLARQLAAQWRGLLPGLHRIQLADGRVQLTLAIGDAQAMLPQLTGRYDSVFLDGFAPQKNPEMWSETVIAAIARLVRRDARLATWCVAAEVRERLARAGFAVERVPGLPPKRHALHARYAPRWQPRERRWPDEPCPLPAASPPGHAVIVGAGLAGASVAHALAARGWRVTVLARGATPADGASALPAGVVAPHVSPDDRPLSRLTRAGVAATVARARQLFAAGRLNRNDWAENGVLERHLPGKRRLPEAWRMALDERIESACQPLSAPLTGTAAERAVQQIRAAIDVGYPALWHRQAGWINPVALVRAMLAQPEIEWRGGVAVARFERLTCAAASAPRWRLFNAAGQTLTDADLLVLAAGFDTLALMRASADPHTHTHTHAPLPPLQALRGQVAYGPMPDACAEGFPPWPVNGNGSLVAGVPLDDGRGNAFAPGWIIGSTFERDQPEPLLREADDAANLAHLAQLLPAAAAHLAPQFAAGRVRAWAAVRCTVPDRLPLVGPWTAAQNAPDAPGDPLATPWLLTGLGARGLPLAVLCGEILAAWLHNEPLPVERRLALGLRAGRWHGRNLQI
ncbi:MAG: FAD-dependent 5-carboxymethylaminomethyl-2-thiouridine(34) oxidoreductase MnmC [Burkholderiaceae bacterium]|jgi:tRNA 5-methylaminomethyl-2-thiouridine biosynthesis bifunctional protein|nr:FAD-dependent 5-carboxymethylaminomethyl-2-thiouridine(34) oxidoreductase MnmC [Burkholderiaceae bacterium]